MTFEFRDFAISIISFITGFVTACISMWIVGVIKSLINKVFK